MIGSVDQVRYFNYARSPEQILEDMSGYGSAYGGQVLAKPLINLNFDDGYGSTAHNSGTTGSTLNGTLTPGSGAAAGMWTDNGQSGKGIQLNGTDQYVSVPDFSY